MSFRQVIETFESVAATSGRNAKIALIDALVRNPEDKAILRDVVMYTQYPFWTYRITAPDTAGMFPKWDDLNDEQSDIAWGQIKASLDALKDRQCELACGRSELKSKLGILPQKYQKYFMQIINRDLKIGIADFKKWFGKIIPSEPVMLCEKWDGEELTGSWTAEPKWDGYRAAIRIDHEGNCDAFSRGNKEFWNWEHIAEELKSIGLRSVVLDGEFFAGSWGMTSSICKSQAPHKDRGLLKYFCFDILPIQEWDEQFCSKVLSERKEQLREAFDRNPLFLSTVQSHLVPVYGVPVSGVDECAEAGDEFYKQGYEGSVLKLMSSKYVWDRTTDWLKIKPEEECDLEVVDTYEGKNRLVGSLGGVIVRGTVTYKKKQYEVATRCGGGFKDTERDEFWAKREQIKGTIIQVRYQDVSAAIKLAVEPGKQALRFPRFMRLRLDKTPNGVGLNS